MPGTDPAEAMRIIAGELPDFPHLPELPDRGPGADLTGRTAGLLIDIPAEVQQDAASYLAPPVLSNQDYQNRRSHRDVKPVTGVRTNNHSNFSTDSIA